MPETSEAQFARIAAETKAKIRSRRGRELAEQKALADTKAKEFLSKLDAANAKTRYGARVLIEPQDGCVVVFSDAHFWPGSVSNANKALVQLLPKLRPYLLINNGDSFDGGGISKYPRIGWDSKPSLKQELDANQERLTEIERAAPNAKRTWNLGNHDARFETRLAAQVPEYQGIGGFHLKDHFPGWSPGWATWIGDEVIVKHRMKGGQYAAALNALHAGRTIVTGHDHALYEKAFTNYSGTHFGIDAGTLQNVWGDMFKDYTEDNSVNWQSGFVILHFRNKRFTGTEFVRAFPDGRVVYRGDLLKV